MHQSLLLHLLSLLPPPLLRCCVLRVPNPAPRGLIGGTPSILTAGGRIRRWSIITLTREIQPRGGPKLYGLTKVPRKRNFSPCLTSSEDLPSPFHVSRVAQLFEESPCAMSVWFLVTERLPCGDPGYFWVLSDRESVVTLQLMKAELSTWGKGDIIAVIAFLPG